MMTIMAGGGVGMGIIMGITVNIIIRNRRSIIIHSHKSITNNHLWFINNRRWFIILNNINVKAIRIHDLHKAWQAA